MAYFYGLILLLSFLISSSHAYKFIVGGKDGWVINPAEGYDQWAQRSRFSVNDTLFFRYKKGSDSVLIVNKDDYFSCNNKNPIGTLTEGDSTFLLDRSGLFFFITGTVGNCNKGQKLIVRVLSPRLQPTPPVSPSPSGCIPTPATPPTHISSPPPTTPSSSPPSPPAPKSPSPEMSPSPTSDEPDLNPPAPTPAARKSGSVALGGNSFGVVLGFTLVMSVVFSSFIGA